MSESLQAAIQRVLSGNADDSDIHTISTAIQTGQVVLAHGNGVIKVDGDVQDSQIITGSHNLAGDKNIIINGDSNIIINGAKAEFIQSILNQRPQISLDTLIQKVRSRASEKVLKNFGKIQLLNRRQVDVDQLYVDVYVLEVQDYRTNIPGLLNGQNVREQFDRLGLAKRGERLQGLKVAESEDYPRLMVLGKPGSGKSTFLRHLAVGCAKGIFLNDYIPYLLELRDLDKTDFSIFQHIHEEFELDKEEQTKQLLSQGKVLVLLDGLDEVSSAVQQKLQDELRRLARRYDKNRFVLTCRTQTTEYIPEQFSPIEVAEFKPEQVESFALNWFTALAETPEQGKALKEHFMEKLREHQQTSELAVTPVLLSLACWIFEDLECLPERRSDLYREGLDLLLKQWDEKRGISREIKSEIYRQLSLDSRKQLLSYLAVRKFDQTENFVLFEEAEICSYISEHLQISEEESRAVLESIAEQHGILVARAHEIWSFSHLTFQEYLVARWFCDGTDLQPLMRHITDYRWREIFLLSSEMLQNRAELLLEVHRLANELIAGNQLIQQILNWVSEKATSLGLEIFSCEQVQLQVQNALLLNSEFADPTQENQQIIIELTPSVPDKSRYIPIIYQQALLRGFCLDLICIYNCDNSLIGDVKIISQLSLYMSFKRKNQFIESVIILDHSMNCFFAYLTKFCAPFFVFEHSYSALTEALAKCAEECSILICIKVVSITLFERILVFWHSFLSVEDTSSETLRAWWDNEGNTLAEQLLENLRKERNICHGWELAEESKELMNKYYAANRLLADCINDLPVTEAFLAEDLMSKILLPNTDNLISEEEVLS
ncbi:NACHT domain-containing protein [Leptolyngbya sp. PCC 6406]|uniref:NACHT domain-containing protein n=1 Tax=Leptolyngbya sp. PCC 6406 TaxID=1173264 RepID=UPI0002ABD097|nr:NACHT domain-containing protein [Leptolyngbya sp. PCC 6406]